MPFNGNGSYRNESVVERELMCRGHIDNRGMDSIRGQGPTPPWALIYLVYWAPRHNFATSCQELGNKQVPNGA